MPFDSIADAGRALAFGGLAVATVAYYLLVRRRRRESDAAVERELDRVRQRARSRFRHFERRDER